MRRSTILGFVLSGLAVLTIVDSAGAQFMGRWNRGGGGWYGGTPYYGSGYNYGTPYYGSSYSYGSPGYYNRYPAYSNWSGTGYNTTVPYSTTYSSAPLDMSTYSAQGYGPSTSQSFYAGPSSYEDRVRLRVVLPSPDARLWLEGRLMNQQMGMERAFFSPSLQPGEYVYTLKASWTDNGREVTREKQVTVRPGQEQTVFFGPADTGRDRGYDRDLPGNTRDMRDRDYGGTRDIDGGARGREGISTGTPGTEGTGGIRTGTQGTGETGALRNGIGIGGTGTGSSGAGSTGSGSTGTSGTRTGGSGTGSTGTGGTGTGGTSSGGTGSSGSR